MTNRSVSIGIMCLIVFSGFLGFFIFESKMVSAPYNPRDPIVINGNWDFTADNGVTGGSGTPGDPYIIEGWEIDANSAPGIIVRNTDAFFEIRDVYVHSGTPSNFGIFLSDVANGRVAGAAISGNRDGIYLWKSTNLSIAANNISSNDMDGVSFNSCTNVSIVANNLSSNLWLGIAVGDSTDVSILANNISSNGWGGITIGSSTDVSIRTNNVSSNLKGIELMFSTNVSVHHNTLIGNTVQAMDSAGPENAWDDGYPSGGNYWSDYTGVDRYSGPNQDRPGSDNIGDTPHDVDYNSQDRYPLMFSGAMVPPRPPEISQATLSGKDLENVTLTWSLSPDDGRGLKSVVAYEIYRNMSYNSRGLGYELIASLPNGTSTFVDNYTGEGDPNDYFYRVCALDLNDNTTCAMDQWGKFTRLLSQGPNLISIPLIQSNESIERVLQTVEYDKAWYYDSSSQEWKWYMTSKGYRRGLWNVNRPMGLWVNVTSDCNLTVAGIVPAQTAIHLYEGWNLVSFPSFNSSYTVADLKAEIGATRVEGYDLTAPPNFLRVLGDAEALLAGEAYWVKVDVDVDWIVEVA